jgi:AmmeMemoRadiSam system protein B
MSIRQPAVSGLFYPDDPATLRQSVADYLAQIPPAAGEPPKALIVPHAGYIYSAPVAASAYAQLAGVSDRIRRVVLLGPSHRVPFSGLAVSGDVSYRTPIGDIPVDQDAVRDLLLLPQVVKLDVAHANEHSLEVQLPFLQLLLEDFVLVPLVVGDAECDQVAEVLERLWGGAETLIVISSDLSHYHDYATAQRMDRATSQAIIGLHPEQLGYDDACGRIPVAGLLTLARQRGLAGELLDLRNSGDTAGDKQRVVGYGAYAFADGHAA